MRRVHDIVEGDLQWHFGPEPLPDYGVDALAEVVTEDDLVTGRLLGLQIKGGDSYFRRPKGEEGWTFRASSDHLAYWLGHSLPVLVVLVDPKGHAFWQVITTRTIKEHKKGSRSWFRAVSRLTGLPARHWWPWPVGVRAF